MNAFELTVGALREKGLNSDQILEELSKLFRMMSDEAQTASAPKLLTDRQKEDKLRDLFTQLGLPRHLKGYPYSIKAVMIYDKNPGVSITKELYPVVAKEFNTTRSRVERAIRHVVEVSFNRCDFNVLDKMFGNTISREKGRPTNSEFIAMCAELLNREK